MQPRLAIVSTPIMRSYTGGLVSAGISTISGFIVTNLDFENLGNNNSWMPEQNVPVGSTIKQNSPDSFGSFCRGSVGMYNTFDGSAQTFAFDYSVAQSKHVFCYCVIGNSFVRRLRIVGS